MNNFDDILLELGYRVPGGIVDLTKDHQVTELVNILRENGFDNPNELAQKARVYFSYLKEIDEAKPKVKVPIEKIMNQTVTNTDTKKKIKVSSALQYKNSDNAGQQSAYQQAQAMFQQAGYDDKEIDKISGAAKPEQPKVKGASVFGPGKGADVFSKKPSTSNSKASPELNNMVDSINDLTTNQTKKHYKNGFVAGAAPGNAGSMLNENGSNDVAQHSMESGNTDIGKACLYLYSQLKGGKLLEANSQGSAAAGISTKTLNELRAKNPELKKLNDAALSRILIAASSGIIKANDARNAIKNNGWKEDDCVFHGYFGDKVGLEAQAKIVEKATRIVGPDGSEIPRDFAMHLIQNSGKAANPSDTAQFTYNSKTGELAIQFSSDKDSFDAIVAQSSFAKEGEIKKRQIDDLIKSGKLNSAGGEKIKELIDKQTQKLNKIEEGLKDVAAIPASAMLKLDSKKVGNALKTISSGADPMKYYNKVVPKYGKTEKEAISNFLTKAKNDPQSLSKDEGEIIARLKKVFNLDNLVASKIDEIRKKSVDVERQMLDEMNKIKIPITGGKVGMGDYMDALNFVDKFHMAGAMGDTHGVFKYDGLFKVVCGFGVINNDIIRNCMNTNKMDDFIKKFGSEKEELQRSKTNNITGSVRIAYFLNDKGERIRIGEKRQRSKTGETGRFNTVYKWDKDTINCFKQKNGIG
jgi:hypothetical protein